VSSHLLPGESLGVDRWSVGERASWRRTVRGGYGFAQYTDVTIRKIGASSMQIEVPLRNGSSRLVWVSSIRLSKPAGKGDG
jgi:hypothetical protein